MITERTEYNGKPTLTIKRFEDEKYPFSFGVEKAQRILECLDEIRKFVNDHAPASKTESTPKRNTPTPNAQVTYPASEVNDDDLPF